MAAQSSTSGGGPGPASVPFTSSSSSQLPPTISVEMSELDASSARTGAGSQGLLNDVSIPETSPLGSSFPSSSSAVAVDMSSSSSVPASERHEAHSTAAMGTSQHIPSSTNDASTNTPAADGSQPSSSSIPGITRHDSTPTDNTTTPAISEAGPVLVITLLLASGARHPYKIDERYLIKRNVNVPGLTESGRKDPFSISVYTLKELILREWREEWETQPSSPSSIRLIFFGRLLDDKTPLKECKFNAESANVVHMSVRPQDVVDEEDASKSKAGGRDRGDNEATAGCRCVIL